MRLAMYVLAFVVPLAASAASPTEGPYLVSGWSCASPGPLPELAKLKPHDVWPAGLEDRVKKVHCIPEGSLKPWPTNVIAFLGPVSFICERQHTEMFGDTFWCRYVSTSSVLTADGKPVLDHFSKRSPSPGFFDSR